MAEARCRKEAKQNSAVACLSAFGFAVKGNGPEEVGTRFGSRRELWGGVWQGCENVVLSVLRELRQEHRQEYEYGAWSVVIDSWS